MADPLRRTLLAKLRGKKAKKAAVANGGGGGNFKAKVSPPTTTTADSPQLSGRAVAAVELDSTASGGKQGRCLNGGLDGGVVRLVSGLRENGENFNGRDDGGGRFWDERRRREQLAGGDSIGFGNASWGSTGLEHGDRRTVRLPEAAWKRNGTSECREAGWDGALVLDQGASSVSLRAGAEPAEPVQFSCINGRLLDANSSVSSGSGLLRILHANADDLGLIHLIESSLERDLRMPALQSPAFFPTELEILDSKVGPRLLWDTEGSNRHNSVDSEDEDYYDNEILPLYGSGAQNLGLNGSAGASQSMSVHFVQSSQEETDRLRTRLKEAYCFLINTTRSMAFDGQAQSGSSSQSRDSVRSVCSRSSTRLAESDTCSSGQHSGQQACGSDWALLDLGESCGARFGGSQSRSLQCLAPESCRPQLQRSASDSGVRYSTELSQGEPCTVNQSGSVPEPIALDNTLVAYEPATSAVFIVTEATVLEHMGNAGLPDHTASVDQSPGEPHMETQSGSMTDPMAVHDTVPVCEPVDECLHPENTETEALVSDMSSIERCSGSISSLVGSSDSPDVPAQKSGPSISQQLSQSACTGTLGKPPGVTVNKMQEWMHKGRVLSSEMRQRIAGSSLRGPQGQDGQAWPKASAHPASATHTAKPGSVGSAGGPQPALTFSSSMSGRESCPRPAPLNSITVSKKRNWLHQSSTRLLHHLDDVPAPRTPEDDHVNTNPIIVLSQDAPPLRLVDPAEENDADDEGEIWYNPIPEDEEADLPHCVPAVQPLLLQPPSPGWAGGAPRRPSAGGEEGRAGEGSNGEAGKANVTHSCEQNHLQRQMCRPDVQESLPARTAATESPEQSTVGFSPPTSPNPAKKSCSINWSFPDRIKSPRTVRKLSMKLSRKLSVKGNHISSASNGQSESRIHPARDNRTAERSTTPPGGMGTASASGNVICRYHLDSSVSTQQHSYSKKKGSGDGVPKSTSKGGYLSDGDSPELVAKSSKHGLSEGKTSRARDKDTGAPKTEEDLGSFSHYSFSEQPKCTTYISGHMTLHFRKAKGLKPPQTDPRHVYCNIQVDTLNKARTALMTCHTDFLDMDHTFNIQVENAQLLKLALVSWDVATHQNRSCCHGTVVLPTLFRTPGRTHKLAVRLVPRGTFYVKIGLTEDQSSLEGFESDKEHEANVFGVDATHVVEKEAAGLKVPLIIEKCITEIERRGCQVVGLYRLCGSAAVKKELREAFERDSHAVELSESNYPDINVITGVLKDYLRELPSPLISKSLYEAVLEAMAKRPLLIGTSGCENDPADSEHTVSLLETLPEVEKMTLQKLLDHLKRVASHHEVNKMTCQNLAVCFGPVLLSQRQEASCLSNRVFVDSEELASALHFKKHIEVLHYLLQLWPVVDAQGKPPSPAPDTPIPEVTVPTVTAPVRRRKDRPQVLNLTDVDLVGVLRPRAGRLDSPSNRYAGDWSGCRETYLQQPHQEEADYDDVPSEEPSSTGHEESRKEAGDGACEQDAVEVDESMEKAESTQAEVVKEQESAEEQTEESVSVSGPQDIEEPVLKPWGDQILLERDEHRPKEHTYQAYMKIHEISPVLSNRVNLRDLQESIDTLIGNLERELNKTKLNVGY
ncbi:rho GTPase-activating protein SYDE2 [Colossoma macropomum]|uniref:rho GTPase-activating protein SYDE2 n=1 Tax=Colossoma macropomum TaxID=42526 RepID=UPI001863A521|nr:rho GTPase-activating protein SYDE2 [Colossoma macropomum]